MEFGIFSQMHVPEGDDEHERFRREVEVAEAVDAVGFKYDWAPEHHFLSNYSHQPAPEVFLSYVAARTEQIHVGHAIVNITAPVNHPARVAERIATLDHLSEGRVEFGTGRGSSSTEWAGFAVPSLAETKPMWRESLEQIPEMWKDEPYAFEGKYFRMPERNVLPKPFSKPNPPIWVACSSPQTFVQAGELGLGALCFTLGEIDDVVDNVRAYKHAVARCTNPVGGFVNDNIAVTSNMFCLEDGDEARDILVRGRPSSYLEFFFQYLDSFPRPEGLPAQGRVSIPQPTVEDLKAATARGGHQVGTPDEVAAVVQRYADAGVDQLIYAPLVHSVAQRDVLRSIECFGKHVLPRFDREPVHRTTHLREQALRDQAA